MTQHLHACTICFRPKVVFDVISGRNVKTIGLNLAVNFEVASCSSSRDIFLKKHFVTAAAAAAAEADIDDSIKRKRFRVSLKSSWAHHTGHGRPPNSPRYRTTYSVGHFLVEVPAKHSCIDMYFKVIY